MKSLQKGDLVAIVSPAKSIEKKFITYAVELIEKQGWQCGEGNTDIPDQTLGFSCEPEQTLGLLTVYWLNGSNGQQQLSQWRDKLAAQQGMVCTINNVRLFDTQENIPNPLQP